MSNTSFLVFDLNQAEAGKLYQLYRLGSRYNCSVEKSSHRSVIHFIVTVALRWAILVSCLFAAIAPTEWVGRQEVGKYCGRIEVIYPLQRTDNRLTQLSQVRANRRWRRKWRHTRSRCAHRLAIWLAATVVSHVGGCAQRHDTDQVGTISSGRRCNLLIRWDPNVYILLRLWLWLTAVLKVNTFSNYFLWLQLNWIEMKTISK